MPAHPLLIFFTELGDGSVEKVEVDVFRAFDFRPRAAGLFSSGILNSTARQRPKVLEGRFQDRKRRFIMLVAHKTWSNDHTIVRS